MKVHSFSCGELGIFPRRQIEDAQPCLIFHKEETLFHEFFDLAVGFGILIWFALCVYFQTLQLTQ